MKTRVLGMYVQREGAGTNNYKGKKLLDRLPKGEISTVRGKGKERAMAVTGFYRTECEVRSLTTSQPMNIVKIGSRAQKRPDRDGPTRRMVPSGEPGETAMSVSLVLSPCGSQRNSLSSASSVRSPLG
jgi:hypothetical protein